LPRARRPELVVETAASEEIKPKRRLQRNPLPGRKQLAKRKLPVKPLLPKSLRDGKETSYESRKVAKPAASVEENMKKVK
jgi:hypothetical protein